MIKKVIDEIDRFTYRNRPTIFITAGVVCIAIITVFATISKRRRQA